VPIRTGLRDGLCERPDDLRTREAFSSRVGRRFTRPHLRPPGEGLVTIASMMHATIAATVVEMPNGRLVLLVEMEPDAGLGPLVIDPVGSDAAFVDRDERSEGH
jgi:hypothetical protein